MYADELSDFFEDTLLDQFSTDAEDGSCREVRPPSRQPHTSGQ